MKKLSAVITAVLILISLSACGKEKSATASDLSVSSLTVNEEAMVFTFSDREKNPSYEGGISITLGESIPDTDGIKEADGHLKITAEGVYVLSGKYSSYIEISAKKTDKVTLVLNGAEIKNSSGPAIYISSADKVFLTIAEGTKNLLSDGEEYTFSADEKLDATVFSRADLCINGSGRLDIKGNRKHAVVSKDDLVITGGTLNISAENVALDGKDCLKICGGTVNISAGTDGMRSSNTEDSDRGYIYISDGKINISSGSDGMQAETLLRIDGGEFSITSGKGSQNISDSEKKQSGNHAILNGNDSTEDLQKSAKGFKAAAKLSINGGTATLDTEDDSLHSNGSVNITSGTLYISSGDDGIHADGELYISGGEIEIAKSYEGIEGGNIKISGGRISLSASDDGINAASEDSSSFNGRPEPERLCGENCSIEISGGYILIDAEGDGIDSNGDLTVSGGITLINGPESSSDGALDYEGSAVISGGFVVAVGAAGMAAGFTDAEEQGAIITTVNGENYETSIALCDGDSVIVSFTPKKSFASVVFSAPKIKEGGTYSVVTGGTAENADENGFADSGKLVGGTVQEKIKMDSLLYGSSGGMGEMGHMPDHGGFMQRPNENGMPKGEPDQKPDKKPDEIGNRDFQ